MSKMMRICKRADRLQIPRKWTVAILNHSINTKLSSGFRLKEKKRSEPS